MSYDATEIWKSQTTCQLADALTLIKDTQSMRNFLRDVMTEKEIIEVSARLEAARMLTEGEKYTDITRQTKLSSRTVARISDWLKTGCNGYQAALKTIDTHHGHIPPVRAD